MKSSRIRPAEPYSVDLALYRYLPLMHELVVRIQLVADACDGRLKLEPPFAREYSYFQFRRMCEIIALGVLILNGDIPGAQTEKIKREWSADRIMRILHTLHPDMFPQALTIEAKPGAVNITANAIPNALTLAEFRKLYAECGEVLHRGSVRGLEEEGPLEVNDYQKVIDWQQKIVSLMNIHGVGRAELKGLFIVYLKSENGSPVCDFVSDDGAGGKGVKKYTMEIATIDQHAPMDNFSNIPLRYIIKSQ